jgi:hypothetical protein
VRLVCRTANDLFTLTIREQVMSKFRQTVARVFTLTACCALPLAVGCNSMEDNEGSVLTTTTDQQLTESMFLGKWDLDGERTNTVNGQGGVEDIPSDVFKDVLGAGWEFQRNGVLKIDRTIGTRTATWRIEGANALVINDPDKGETRYEASFRDGYMYLKNPAGRWMVMEKGKFFGF